MKEELNTDNWGRFWDFMDDHGLFVIIGIIIIIGEIFDSCN